MMSAWMLYAVCVSLLLTLAAGCAAHGARLHGAPARFIWAPAMMLSLLGPAAMSSVSVTLPAWPADAAGPPRTVALRDLPPGFLAPAALVPALPGAAVSRTLDAALPRLWAAASLLMGLAWLVQAGLLAWRKRSWSRASLAGTPVLVAPDAGPALAGLLVPRIVVPGWMLGESGETHRYVIAHEQAHLDAGDTRLLAAAIAVLVVMPWNLPLWWQLARLRFAIETDCDARVIAAGAAPARYADMLIGIGERRARRFGPTQAMAMADPASELEKRISLMLDVRRRTALTLLPGLAAALMAASAAAVTPPNAGPPADLGRLTGAYAMGPGAVLTVSQQDGALFVRLTGQPALRVAARGPASFTAEAVGADFDFTLPDRGQATRVTLHQNGQVIAMARIADGQARRVEAATAARVTRDTPARGSRVALAKLVDGIIAAAPDYSAMTPKLADVVRAQLPALHENVGSLGPVQSISFIRVGEQGQDVYVVKQRQGALTWRILLAGDKIAGAGVAPGP